MAILRGKATLEGMKCIVHQWPAGEHPVVLTATHEGRGIRMLWRCGVWRQPGGGGEKGLLYVRGGDSRLRLRRARRAGCSQAIPAVLRTSWPSTF